MRERDFMGLISKEVIEIKDENDDDGCRDQSGLTRGAPAQWPFSNKVSTVPHFMSFRGAQEDKTKKMIPESFLSSAFEPCQKRPTSDARSVPRSFDMKMISVSNQGISVPMGNPYLKNHYASMGQNFAVTTTKQQLFGGIPVTPYSAPPTSGSNVGTTEPWNNVKTSGSPSQMTIFYAGSVNVYNDISPEKAQAMMVLAQNGSSISSRGAHSKAEAPRAKLAAEDGVPVKQTRNTLASAFPSPLFVSSHNGTQSVSGSTSTDEPMAAKTTGLPTTPVSKVEPPKTVNAVKSVAATTLVHSAIPQARKASLARFLGKRKERVINSAPYKLSKKSEEGSKPECNG